MQATRRALAPCPLSQESELKGAPCALLGWGQGLGTLSLHLCSHSPGVGTLSCLPPSLQMGEPSL